MMTDNERKELLMKAKPILFNTDMVRAILDGRKTVTRRVIKLRYGNTHIEWHTDKYGKHLVEIQNDVEGETRGVRPDGTHFQKVLAMRELEPPYKVGDILYVRETWSPVSVRPKRYLYKTDCPEADDLPVKWHPSIHMPKEAARIFLRVTDVRVERLQDIITGDYRTPININKEGLLTPCCDCPHHNGDCKDFIAQKSCILLDGFIELINSTVKKSDLDRYGWNANPFVWVIEFERMIENETD